MIKINEIFHSIQGESTLVGTPTIFVRTTGCHLRCVYCDTTHAYYEGSFLSEELILERIESYGTKHVCVTGGEPLLQREIFSLLQRLCNSGYKVSLETSGDRSCKDVDPRVKVILDVKTPGSGEGNRFDFSNLSSASPSTEIKFVLCSEEDLEWSEAFCRQHDLFEKFVVLYSPSFGEIEPKWLAEKILQKKSPARLQLQQHKYIWSPYTRGV